MSYRRVVRPSIILPLAALIAALLAASAQATTITVNSLTDTGTGCTLRKAVDTANTDAPVSGCSTQGSGADTIDVPAGTITLTSSPTELSISSEITIAGQGMAGGPTGTTVTQSPAGRIFHVTAPNGRLTLEQLEVYGGVLNNDGGGIWNESGTLTLDRVRVDNNQAVGSSGGGIFAGPGSVTVIFNSEVDHNQAGITGGALVGGSGGGIYVGGGVLWLQGSRAHDNKALVYASSPSNADGNGAGIAALPFGPTYPSVTIQGSRVDHNDADNDGGGVHLGNGGTLRVTGSAVNNNQAKGTSTTGDGAGIFLLDVAPSGTHEHRIADSVISENSSPGGGGLWSDTTAPQSLLVDRATIESNSANGTGGSGTGGGAWIYGDGTIRNSTFTDNSAPTGGAIRGGDLGQLSIVHSTIAGNQSSPAAGAINFDSGTLVLSSSILDNPTGGDCYASPAPTSAGHNVVSDASCALGGPGDLNSTDPLLASLADNGGPSAGVSPVWAIPTQALLAGSPAIDHSPCAGLTVDERGFPRPSPSTGLCDSGAFELTQPEPPGPPAAQSPPPPPPSNLFGFGKLKHNKKKGIAYLKVKVPGPGLVGITGRGIAKFGLGSKHARTSGGHKWLRVKPAKKGKKARKLRQRLQHEGKAKTKLWITFLPDGGSANTKVRKVKLVEKLAHRR
ncbi:MAG: CSLREA domain-containing protein [Solirubrobacterales bacterium]